MISLLTPSYKKKINNYTYDFRFCPNFFYSFINIYLLNLDVLSADKSSSMDGDTAAVVVPESLKSQDFGDILDTDSIETVKAPIPPVLCTGLVVRVGNDIIESEGNTPSFVYPTTNPGVITGTLEGMKGYLQSKRVCFDFDGAIKAMAVCGG